MDEAQLQMETSLRVAKEALERYEADPTPPHFRMWRDASEVAVKWYRQWRLGGGQDEDSFERGLQNLISTK